MSGEDGLQGDGLLLSRIAMLERRFQSLSRLVLDMRGESEAGEGLAPRAVIDPDSQGELGMGFYHREHDAAGTPFRWAGKSSHFELRFHLDRFTARPFRMIGQFAPGVAVDRLRAYVDYCAIPMKVEFDGARDGAMAAITGRIPADPLGGATTLTFECPAVAAPNPADGRRLSFAFLRLVAGDVEAVREAA